MSPPLERFLRRVALESVRDASLLIERAREAVQLLEQAGATPPDLPTFAQMVAPQRVGGVARLNGPLEKAIWSVVSSDSEVTWTAAEVVRRLRDQRNGPAEVKDESVRVAMRRLAEKGALERLERRGHYRRAAEVVVV